MFITKKDKALAILMLSFLLFSWIILSVFFNLHTISLQKRSKLFNSINNLESSEWFNIDRSLKKNDFQGRLVILNFWNSSNAKSIIDINNLKQIKKKFSNNILLIGIHIPSFKNEKDQEFLKELIIKNNINYPVINDYNLNIYKKFNLKGQGVVLVNPSGQIEEVLESNFNKDDLIDKISKLIKKYSLVLEKSFVEVDLEKNNVPKNILSFPTKIEYANNFIYNDKKISALLISNSSNNNIIISTVDGEIIDKIGSDKSGFEDGSFSDAKFNYPSGLLYKNNILYVADRDNNAIRVVDFKKRLVSTLTSPQDEIMLTQPTDLEYFPDNKNLIISSSGSGKLFSYNLENKQYKIFFNGSKNIDGISSLKSYKGKLYFSESINSSIKFLDKNGDINKFIDSKSLNLNRKNTLPLNYPQGFYIDNSGFYIADSYNNVIRKYDHTSNSIINYSGNLKRGDDIGKITSYNEVSDLTSVSNKFFIVDSNNNRIVVKNRRNGKTSILDIVPKAKFLQENFLKYLPDLKKSSSIEVQSKENINLVLILSKGWKINEKAPSFFNLIEIKDNKEAKLLASFDWNIIKTKKIKLPKLMTDRKYYLQGVVYYCEDKENSLCYIYNYQKNLTPSSNSNNNLINIDL